MAELRELLRDRIGDNSVDNFMYDVNAIVRPEEDDRITVATMYAYLGGTRNIAGKGARLLAQYFYAKQDFSMVDAIARVTLGVPYPVPDVGNGKN